MLEMLKEGEKVQLSLNEEVANHLQLIVHEWLERSLLKYNDVLVIGCSTSEVAGKRIGTSGSKMLAEVIYKAIQTLKAKASIQLAFQCCEHLNRALGVERKTMYDLNLKELTVIPYPSAGGSLASYAYEQMEEPVVVEAILADAGMDIGQTMIGMHLKHVAVPLRFKQRTVGRAQLTVARTRPKLIGGHRAKYPLMSI